ICHLDRPYGDWPRAVTTTPADLMGLREAGRIGPGLPADLVLFEGRTWSELLSRPQSNRVVLRNGVAIDRRLPDYRELDDLVGGLRLPLKTPPYTPHWPYPPLAAAARAGLFPAPPYPANTRVVVQALADPHSLVEIEGIAVLD